MLTIEADGMKIRVSAQNEDRDVDLEGIVSEAISALVSRRGDAYPGQAGEFRLTIDGVPQKPVTELRMLSDEDLIPYIARYGHQSRESLAALSHEHLMELAAKIANGPPDGIAQAHDRLVDRVREIESEIAVLKSGQVDGLEPRDAMSVARGFDARIATQKDQLDRLREDFAVIGGVQETHARKLAEDFRRIEQLATGEMEVRQQIGALSSRITSQDTATLKAAIGELASEVRDVWKRVEGLEQRIGSEPLIAIAEVSHQQGIKLDSLDTNVRDLAVKYGTLEHQGRIFERFVGEAEKRIAQMIDERLITMALTENLDPFKKHVDQLDRTLGVTTKDVAELREELRRERAVIDSQDKDIATLLGRRSLSRARRAKFEQREKLSKERREKANSTKPKTAPAAPPKTRKR